MTALAVALVLCCAMVCGTVLTLRLRARRDADVSDLREQHEALVRESVKLSGVVVRLTGEVEQLRASMALRSM